MVIVAGMPIQNGVFIEIGKITVVVRWCVCVCVYVMYTHTRMIVYVLMYVDVMIHISYIYTYLYTIYINMYIYIYIIHIINNIYIYIIHHTSTDCYYLCTFFFVLFPLSWRKTLVGEGWSWIYIIHMLYSIALVMVVGTPAILGYTVQM